MNPPPTQVMDSAGPALAAVGFVVLMARVPEPVRRKLNAVLAAGVCSAYLSGGLGPWELLYPALATPVVYFGFGSYRFIGLAWLMHAGWDLVHHLWGNSLWPFMATASWGCMIFDSAIAAWFLAGAPTSLSKPVDPVGGA